MFGLSFGLKGMAIAAGIALLAGLGTGWKVRDAFCDAASAKAEVETLKTQIRARDFAGVGDGVRALNDAAERARLESKVDELQSQISDGECLSDADARRVLDLWKR